jgi:hypothetical protein
MTKKPNRLVILVIGGISLEESFELQSLTHEFKGVNIVAGGTNILNTEE